MTSRAIFEPACDAQGAITHLDHQHALKLGIVGDPLHQGAADGIREQERTDAVFDGFQLIPWDLNLVESGTESDLVMRADDVLVISESTSSRTLRTIGGFLKGLFSFGYYL